MKAAQRWRFNDANNRYTFIGLVRNVFDDEGFRVGRRHAIGLGCALAERISGCSARVWNRSAISFRPSGGMQEINKRQHGFNSFKHLGWPAERADGPVFSE